MQSSSSTQATHPSTATSASGSCYMTLDQAMERFDEPATATFVTNFLRTELDDDGSLVTKACTGYIHNHVPSAVTERSIKVYMDRADRDDIREFLPRQEAVTERFSRNPANIGTSLVSVTPETFQRLRARKDSLYWQQQSEPPEVSQSSRAPSPSRTSTAAISHPKARELLHGNDPVTFIAVARVHYREVESGGRKGEILCSAINRSCTNTVSPQREVLDGLRDLHRGVDDQAAFESCESRIQELNSARQGGIQYHQVPNEVMDQILTDPWCSIPWQRASRQQAESREEV